MKERFPLWLVCFAFVGGMGTCAGIASHELHVLDATDESHPDRVLAWVRQPNGPRVLFECLPVSPTRTEK